MRALTIQQPWAEVVASGVKTVENRSWSATYRGPLAIHAALRWSERGAADPRVTAWHGKRMFPGTGFPCYPLPDPGLFPRGVVVATAELVDIHPDGGCCRPWGESEYVAAGGRTQRRVHHWILEGIERVDYPILCRGRLGLWVVPRDVTAALT